MYTVLIAEDELWIRKSIMKMIQWDNLGLILSGEVCDGQDAFEMALVCKPNILITDVRMPGMNGLDLAEKLSSTFPNLKIIIISGYDEFQYVKRAIDIDVISYVLKPILEAELNSALQKAVKEIDENNEKTELKENIPYITQKLVSDVIDFGSGEYIKRFFKWLQSHKLLNNEYVAAIIHFDLASYDLSSMRRLFEQSAAEICGDQFETVFFERLDNRLGVLVIKKNPSKELITFFNNLWLILKKENITNVLIAVGDTYSKPENLGKSFSQAVLALESKRLTSEDKVIFYSSPSSDKEPIYPLYLQRNIITAVVLNERVKLKDALDEANKSLCNTTGFTLKHAKEFFAASASDIIKVLLNQESFDRCLIEEGFQFCSHIDQHHKLSSLVNWMNVYSIKVLDYLESYKGREIGRIVSDAVDYIKKNFQEDITLNFLATKYHINSGYLSSMFKQKVGKSFVEFLTCIRMQKSAEYLSSSNVNISKVASMVGYEDVRYFGKLFKKHFGKLPTEYRNELLNR